MYIKDSHSISPQNTKDLFNDSIVEHEGNKYFAIESSIKDYIPKALLRRMGKGIRLGIGSGLPLLNKHAKVDGIIIATTSNGLGDCILFLNQIKEYDEGTLTPTHFVQSTPNSISGQLALMSENPCYNITHVHYGNAFENALIDAELLFQKPDVQTVLLGDVEEISSYNYSLDHKRNKFKKEAVSSSHLIASNTHGTVSGEGSSMFILSKTNEDAQAKVIDTCSVFERSLPKLKDSFEFFLKKNDLETKDFDAIILGYNGNLAENETYDQFAELFNDKLHISFKNLVGEYSTSTSFAMYFAAQIIKQQKVPAACILKGSFNEINRLLIINSFQTISHNFIILERP